MRQSRRFPKHSETQTHENAIISTKAKKLNAGNILFPHLFICRQSTDKHDNFIFPIVKNVCGITTIFKIHDSVNAHIIFCSVDNLTPTIGVSKQNISIFPYSKIDSRESTVNRCIMHDISNSGENEKYGPIPWTFIFEAWWILFDEMR